MEKIKQFFIKNKKKIVWLFSFFVFLFLLLSFFTYIIYVKSPFLNKIRSVFYFPVVIVGDSWITFGKFEERVLVLENNFKNQDFSKAGIRIDFKTEDGKKRFEIEKKRVLSSMIEEEIIKDLAREHKVSITSEMVDMEVERLLKQNPDPKGKIKEIKEIWGISLDDYKRLVVLPAERRNKLEKHLSEEDVNEEVKNKINQAKKELDDGRSFSDVANKYSEGIIKDKGGALGWFNLDDLVIKEVRDVVSNLEVNKNSEIIESRLGFHIVRISDVKTLSSGEKMVYLNQILVKKKTLADFLEEKLENSNIFIPVKEYVWTDECDLCEEKKKKDKKFDEKLCKSICFKGLDFTTKEMRDFEIKVQKEYEEYEKLQIIKGEN